MQGALTRSFSEESTFFLQKNSIRRCVSALRTPRVGWSGYHRLRCRLRLKPVHRPVLRPRKTRLSALSPSKSLATPKAGAFSVRYARTPSNKPYRRKGGKNRPTTRTSEQQPHANERCKPIPLSHHQRAFSEHCGCPLRQDTPIISSWKGCCETVSLAVPHRGHAVLTDGSEKAKQAIEPVFGLGDDADFQTFRSVFRTGLDDLALSNAVLLTATFAVSDDRLDAQSLHFQAETIKTLRRRISYHDSALTLSTLGAILLLAGIEVRPSPTSAEHD
jgi:hypothetical protein